MPLYLNHRKDYEKSFLKSLDPTFTRVFWSALPADKKCLVLGHFGELLWPKLSRPVKNVLVDLVDPDCSYWFILVIKFNNWNYLSHLVFKIILVVNLLELTLFSWTEIVMIKIIIVLKVLVKQFIHSSNEYVRKISSGTQF